MCARLLSYRVRYYLARYGHPDTLAVGNVAEIVRFGPRSHHRKARAPELGIDWLFASWLVLSLEHRERPASITFQFRQQKRQQHKVLTAYSSLTAYSQKHFAWKRDWERAWAPCTRRLARRTRRCVRLDRMFHWTSSSEVRNCLSWRTSAAYQASNR